MVILVLLVMCAILGGFFSGRAAAYHDVNTLLIDNDLALCHPETIIACNAQTGVNTLPQLANLSELNFSLYTGSS